MINLVSTWSKIVCGVSYPFHTTTGKNKLGIYFAISSGFLCIMLTSISRESSRILRKKNTWSRTWHVQEHIWGALFRMLLFRRYQNCCAGSNWTWGIYWYQYYSSFWFVCFFWGYFEPSEVSQIRDDPGENFSEFGATILVDSERLESDRAFDPENLGFITHIFENTSYPISHIWEYHKYK